MKNKVSKVIALMLSLMLVLSMNAITLADEKIVTDETSIEETAEIIEQISEETIETVVEETVITCTVAIFACYNDELTNGDWITLISEVTGLQGCSVSYQWQRDTGNGLEDIAGANDASYCFAASEETLACNYRLAVFAK